MPPVLPVAETGGGGTQVLQVPVPPLGWRVDTNVPTHWSSHHIHAPEVLGRSQETRQLRALHITGPDWGLKTASGRQAMVDQRVFLLWRKAPST